MKERTTPDSRNTPSTTNLEEEEIVDAPGNDGNASMPEQVKRPNPWRKMKTINSVASYMFRLPTVVIFREVFFEIFVTKNAKQVINIKSQVLNKRFKICVNIKKTDKTQYSETSRHDTTTSVRTVSPQIQHTNTQCSINYFINFYI